MNKRHAISLGLCCMIAMPIACAQDAAREMPVRGPIPFSVYDKDSNGTISKEEFLATRGERIEQRTSEGRPMRGLAGAPAFEAFDTDGDGQLTETELRAGQQAQQRPGIGSGPRGPGGGMDMPTFAEYDLNADGKLTDQEFNEARAKRIEERAQEGRQMRNLPNAPTFADLDTNGDGGVTPEEFTAHQRQQRAPW